MSLSNFRLKIQEDWAAVALAFFIIILVILQIAPTTAPVYAWTRFSDLLTTLFSPGSLWNIVLQFLFMMIIALVAALLTGRPLRSFALMFPIVYLITFIAIVIAGNAYVKTLNLEAVIFSLVLGLIVSNLFALPAWFRKALSVELFVKIGLVLLGASIIFSDILKAGSLGLIQSLIVVITVWYFAWWISKKLSVDKEMAMMLSSAVSICGVSAAIATAGAIEGDPKKLSCVISLVLLAAIPMMLGMPWVAARLGLSQEVTGAWLGGTIDTTGAVVASGSLVGETALKISTIVKFSQNVLLGLAAFVISIYWTYTRRGPSREGGLEKPTLKVIWDRFPKFVLGFLAASLLFSFFLEPDLISRIKNPLRDIQTLWFALAFTSIGLETNFSELFNASNRKPLFAFLIAQAFNIVITLIIAMILFK